MSKNSRINKTDPTLAEAGKARAAERAHRIAVATTADGQTFTTVDSSFTSLTTTVGVTRSQTDAAKAAITKAL